MPRKIGFTVVSSSSHEENFSAQELMVHAPTVSGWRSSRYNGEYLTTIDTLFLPIKSILSIIKMLLRELPVCLTILRFSPLQHSKLNITSSTQRLFSFSYFS